MSEKTSVYLETTIPSFLTARPSNDVLIAGKQEATRQWWEQRKKYYQLYISELVIEEANRGDSDAAQRRMNAVFGIEIIEIDDEMLQ